ncbi:histidine kinase [Sphingomonas sp. NIBR02145]|uniref:sensor histidine kinase n=1 Tax=Sphingomonas sp. NIBR02145 TaxID=3014784 RepID=UPI0022B2C925|nr:histidine kinase [Sphingomonas sp. NIBR02145]WHU04032.1 histidine kinase [Sphingomonas sp. NIBR02145]
MKLVPEIRQAAWLVALTWILSGVLYLIPFQVFTGLSAYVLVSVILICLLGALLSGGVYLAVRGARGRSPVFRFAIAGGAVVLASAVLAVIDGVTSQWIARLMASTQPPAPFGIRALTNFVALVWQFALLGAAFTVIEANNLARLRERELAAVREAASRAEAAATAARLAALRYQLNPHFLFNTLNAISSLIVTRDYKPADAMLAELSEFLRATLAVDPDAVIALEDELATLQHYLEIESIRFGDRLAVEFVCPPELEDALLPGFTLQPLVENSIKYAVATSAVPVTIRVEARVEDSHLVITVEDDGTGGAAKPGTGVGLANVRQRLEALYGDQGSLETARRSPGFLSTLRLPLTHQPQQGEAA